MGAPENSKERFFANTIKDVRGCLIWQGGRSGKYGKATYKYRTWLAHRLAWFFTYSEDPKNLVCHKCDVPLCVNPEHLFAGNHKDNTQDMISKGRYVSNWRAMPGEKHPMHKLNWEIVRKIRQSDLSTSLLAKTYSVDKSTILLIKQGKTWKE